MKEKIYAIVKKASGAPEIRLLEKDQRTYNTVVEGKREVIPFPNMPGVCIVFDGEAARAKQLNCFLPEYNDLITGTAIFAGIDLEKGFCSLTEEQAAGLEEYLKANDAKGFAGNAGEKIAVNYLPVCEANVLMGLLCEVKSKYKTPKISWMGGSRRRPL